MILIMCDQDCHSVPHELVCVIYSTNITINVQRSAADDRFEYKSSKDVNTTFDPEKIQHLFLSEQ